MSAAVTPRPAATAYGGVHGPAAPLRPGPNGAGEGRHMIARRRLSPPPPPPPPPLTPGQNESPACRGRLGRMRRPARRVQAGLTGLEPATSGVTDRHSNQLSYSPLRRSAAI